MGYGFRRKLAVELSIQCGDSVVPIYMTYGHMMDNRYNSRGHLDDHIINQMKGDVLFDKLNEIDKFLKDKKYYIASKYIEDLL